MPSSSNETMYKTVCMLCFQVCGINAYVKEGKLTRVEPMVEHPFSRGELCSRGLNPSPMSIRLTGYFIL